MKQQHARIAILVHALAGVTASIKGADGQERPIGDASDNELNLAPGESITIAVASDDRWVERQAQVAAQKKAQAAQRDDVDHTVDGKGQTLDEGLEAAQTDAPTDPGTGPGTVTATTGATTRRSTRGTPQA